MPKVSDEHKAAVRERLIRAAIDQLATNGYHATSTRDIMRAAGVSAGTFYHYFPSKDALIAATGDAIAESELGADGIEMEVEGQPAGTTMAQLAVRFFGPLPGYSLLPLARTQAQYVPSIRGALSRYDRRLVDSLAGHIEEAKHDGDLDDGIDAEAMAELSALVFEGLQARARSATFATSHERVGRAFLRLLARGAGGNRSRYRDEIERSLEG